MKHETELVRTRLLGPLRKGFPGSWVEKIPGTAYNKGLPDILASIEGCLVGIEAKKEGNLLTPLQRNKLRCIALAEGVALCVVFKKDGTMGVWDYTNANRKLPINLGVLSRLLPLCALTAEPYLERKVIAGAAPGSGRKGGE